MNPMAGSGYRNNGWIHKIPFDAFQVIFANVPRKLTLNKKSRKIELESLRKREGVNPEKNLRKVFFQGRQV
jgi:hypothetical protein